MVSTFFKDLEENQYLEFPLILVLPMDYEVLTFSVPFQTFNASSAGGDVATFHVLTTNVIATHLRFKPVSNVTCLRVEIYAVPGIFYSDMISIIMIS